MFASICDRFIGSARRRLRAADLPLNLKNALIDEDVRGPRRVQGFVLLRFFAQCGAKTVIFDILFIE